MKIRSHLVISIIAALAVVSCKNNIDNKKLETAITDGLKAKSVTLKSVTCPDDRPAKAGDKFDCEAVTSDGDKLAVKVEQTDDQGNVNWKVDSLPGPKSKDEGKPAGDEAKPAGEDPK